MRIETTHRNVLEFAELTEEQKKKAIDGLRDLNTEGLSDWYHPIIEDNTKMLEALGFYDINIAFSGFCSQGDGASFIARFGNSFSQERYNRFEKDHIGMIDDEMKSLLNIVFDDIKREQSQDDYEDEDYHITRNGRYYHSGTITAYNLNMVRVARYISDKIYVALEKEYDYQQSDKSIKETIEANNYEFYEDTLEVV